MTAPTPPSLSALVECKRLLKAEDDAAYALRDALVSSCNATLHQQMRNALDNRTREATNACTTYVRSLPASGLCHDCENKKLREVLSAPRPDVSLGELTDAERAEMERLCEQSKNDRCWPVGSEFRWLVMLARRMDAALRAQSPAEGGWISVEDRLPEDHQNLWATDGRLTWITEYRGGYWNDEEYASITHWQPIVGPKPPTATPTAIALRESQAEGKSDEK